MTNAAPATQADLIELYRNAKLANLRSAEHSHKATWLDCTRHPAANGYCMQAAATSEEAARITKIWTDAACGLPVAAIVAIMEAA